MTIPDLITIDADILSGQPVFTGTRVPVETLFDYLEDGASLDEFLEEFPTVEREQAVRLLELATNLITSPKVIQYYYAAVA